jgi:hypothetical protein
MINLTSQQYETIEHWVSQDDSNSAISYFFHQDRPDLSLYLLDSAGLFEDDYNPLNKSLREKASKVNFSRAVISRALKAVVLICPNCNHHQFFDHNDFNYSDLGHQTCPSCLYNGLFEVNDHSRSKTFNKYLELITAQPKRPWSESDLRGLRKSIGSCGSLKDYRSLFIDLINLYGPFNITPEFSDKGHDFLIRKFLKQDKTLRNTKDQALGEREREILLDFSHFTFDAIETHYPGPYSNYYDLYPLYTVHSNDGSSFTYICKMMGGIEVIS